MASSTSPIVDLDTPNLEDATDEEGVVLVDFHATWCGPCKQMEPVLEAIASSAEVKIVKVDVDQHQALAAEHQVRGVPTFLIFSNGELKERLVGYQPEPQLREIIESLSS